MRSNRGQAINLYHQPTAKMQTTPSLEFQPIGIILLTNRWLIKNTYSKIIIGTYTVMSARFDFTFVLSEEAELVNFRTE